MINPDIKKVHDATRLPINQPFNVLGFLDIPIYFPPGNKQSTQTHIRKKRKADPSNVIAKTITIVNPQLSKKVSKIL